MRFTELIKNNHSNIARKLQHFSTTHIHNIQLEKRTHHI